MSEQCWPWFLDWHLRTEHPWDYRLYREAMTMSMDGIRREVAEVLSPAIEKAAAAIRKFIDAYGHPRRQARRDRAAARLAVHVCGPTCKRNRKSGG